MAAHQVASFSKGLPVGLVAEQLLEHLHALGADQSQHVKAALAQELVRTNRTPCIMHREGMGGRTDVIRRAVF